MKQSNSLHKGKTITPINYGMSIKVTQEMARDDIYKIKARTHGVVFNDTRTPMEKAIDEAAEIFRGTEEGVSLSQK